MVFVVDGSPDRCEEILRHRIRWLPFPSQLISLSRNFGSFADVRAACSSESGGPLKVTADPRRRRSPMRATLSGFLIVECNPGVPRRTRLSAHASVVLPRGVPHKN